MSNIALRDFLYSVPKTQIYYALFCIALFIYTTPIVAAELRIAVASNFGATVSALTSHYQANTTDKILLSFGSSGKHYAQIKNGAPFDIFFSADKYRVELLEKEGFAVANSRFTYAIGKLILWSPKTNFVDKDGAVLHQGSFRHLAMANPLLAPYGKAAQEVLQARGIWASLNNRIVRGENINQTLQFITSGNAELGFVAYAQIKQPARVITGSYWEIPQNLYSTIEQQAVILKDSEPARAFIQFMQSPQALKIIHDYGYDTP